MRRTGLSTGVTLMAGIGLLAMAGCSPAPFDIEISGPLERPRLELKISGGLLKSRPLCVEQLQVAKGGLRELLRSGPEATTIWRVEADEGRCTSLRTLTYGETPEGLRASVEPLPLEPGVRYYVSGMARGSYRGGVSVLFEDGGWRIVPDL